MQQGEERRGKVKKGWLAVRVGDDEQQEHGHVGGFRRFVIPIAYLYHPLFRRLLEAARDAYGYDSSGPLRLLCSVDEFLRLRALVERDTHSAHTSSPSSHRVHLAPCTRAKVTS
jgi:SAUR family protein